MHDDNKDCREVATKLRVVMLVGADLLFMTGQFEEKGFVRSFQIHR